MKFVLWKYIKNRSPFSKTLGTQIRFHTRLEYSEGQENYYWTSTNWGNGTWFKSTTFRFKMLSTENILALLNYIMTTYVHLYLQSTQIVQLLQIFFLIIQSFSISCAFHSIWRTNCHLLLSWRSSLRRVHYQNVWLV